MTATRGGRCRHGGGSRVRLATSSFANARGRHRPPGGQGSRPGSTQRSLPPTDGNRRNRLAAMGSGRMRSRSATRPSWINPSYRMRLCALPRASRRSRRRPAAAYPLCLQRRGKRERRPALSVPACPAAASRSPDDRRPRRTTRTGSFPRVPKRISRGARLDEKRSATSRSGSAGRWAGAEKICRWQRSPAYRRANSCRTFDEAARAPCRCSGRAWRNRREMAPPGSGGGFVGARRSREGGPASGLG